MNKLFALGALVLGLIIGAAYADLKFDGQRAEVLKQRDTMMAKARSAVIAGVEFGYRCRGTGASVAECRAKTETMMDSTP